MRNLRFARMCALETGVVDSPGVASVVCLLFALAAQEQGETSERNEYD